MNKVAFVLYFSVLVSLICLISLVFGNQSIEASVNSLRSDLYKQSRSYMESLVPTLRTQLLMGNIRNARTILVGLKKRRVFREYVILEGDRLIDSSRGYNIASKSLSNIKIDVLFSPEGKKWGEISFLVSNDSVVKLTHNLKKGLHTRIIYIGLIIVLITLIFAIIFWVSTKEILPILNASLKDQNIRSRNELTKFVWRPFLVIIDQISKETRKWRHKLVENEKKIALADQAKQVAHDIRSPLTALNMLSSVATTLPENQRDMMRKAVQRVNDIAINLLDKNSDDGNNLYKAKIQSHLLGSIVDSVATEKRLQFGNKRHIEIITRVTGTAYGLFSEVNSVELKRAISNLCNNSVEALEEGGLIEIGLKTEENKNVVYIKDSGKGIPPDILEKLGQEGVTHGKEGTESGSGIGVYGAKKSVESWGGSLKFDSVMGKGTTASIVLPRSEPPEWFRDRLTIRTSTQIVILDDDDSIHSTWKTRFADMDLKSPIIHTHTPDELQQALEGKIGVDLLILCDYELLGFKSTGLDIIEDLDISDKSVLVTGRHEEPHIIDRCKKMKIDLLPKDLATVIPIVLELPIENFHTPK